VGVSNFNADRVKAAAKVGRCRFTVSTPVLKAPVVSVISA